jgi:nitroreductase
MIVVMKFYGRHRGKMELMDAIRSRRSIGKVKQDAIDRQTIEALLEAAVWAPNHRRTEPWKFFVMTGEGRSRLGDAYADIYRASRPEADEEAVEKQRRKAFRAPVVIAVACAPSQAVGVIELEEYGAVYMAIQNMLLAAHALGLGAIVRSGEPMYTERMNAAFGLGPRDKVLGLVYLGAPNMEAPDAWRTPPAMKTAWLDDAQAQE